MTNKEQQKSFKKLLKGKPLLIQNAEELKNVELRFAPIDYFSNYEGMNDDESLIRYGYPMLIWFYRKYNSFEHQNLNDPVTKQEYIEKYNNAISYEEFKNTNIEYFI